MEIFLQFVTPQNITLAFGAAGGVVAVALIVLLILGRKQIGGGVSTVWQSIFSQGGLFYFGMGLFMVECMESSAFNQDALGHAA